MADDSTLLRAVRLLNPEPVDTAGDSGALFARITTQIADGVPPGHDDAALAPRETPVAMRRILAGAATAALVAVGVVSLTHDDAPQAYADWTPMPTDVWPAQIDDLHDECPHELIVPPDQPMPLSPVIAEMRGSATMLLSVADGDAHQLCFTIPDGDGLRTQAEGSNYGPDDAPEPEDSGIVTLHKNTWEPFPDSGPLTVAAGKTGTHVERIRVGTKGGTFADATVADGWWIVWFPDEVELGDMATITTVDGAQLQVPLHED